MYHEYSELISSFAIQDLEGVANQCLKYGRILESKEWVAIGGDNPGFRRIHLILHFGREWQIHMHEGNVIQVDLITPNKW